MATQKILLITTGGTIASQLTEQGMSVSDVNPVADNIAKISQDFAVEVIVVSPLNKNSENFQPQDWFTLLACLSEQPLESYDGVVITHGTDTMHYSLAAISVFASSFPLPICFTGSFYGFDHPQTDAVLNLRAAFKSVLASPKKNGVYLAFKDGLDEQTASIYEAASVKPMGFDEQFFSSVYQRCLAQYKAGGDTLTDVASTEFPVLPMELFQPPSCRTVENAVNQCVVLSYYPGMNIATLQSLAKGKRYIFLELYHSGTADVAVISEFLQALDGKQRLIMASFPSSYINHAYASTVKILNAGACIYRDLPIHYLYVYCVMSLSQTKGEADLTLLKDFQLKN